MSTVLLVVHLLVAIFLVALILLQRSGGGALDGLGGGSGAGNFLTARGTGNLLTRLTAIGHAVFSDQPVAFPLLQGSRQHRRPVHSRQAGGGNFRPRRSGACRTGGSCGTERSGSGKINARQCGDQKAPFLTKVPLSL